MKHLKLTLLLIISLFTLVLLNQYFQPNDLQAQEQVKEQALIIPSNIFIVEQEDMDFTNNISADFINNICQDYVLPIENINDWKQEKIALIKEIYKRLQTKKINLKKIDYISDFSGVGFMKGRIFSNLQKDNEFLPRHADNDSELMTEVEQKLFIDLLTENNYKALANAFLKGIIPLNKYVLKDWKYLPPISHILNHESNEAGQNFILELIKLGEKPTFIDLITATKLNLQVSFVSHLYNANNIDATRIYIDIGDYKSLSLIATEVRSTDLLEYWLSLDSPASPDMFNGNSLDLISSLKDESDKETFLEMFITLMSNGVRANQEWTSDDLSNWLPDDIRKRHEAEYSILNDNKLPKAWKPFVYLTVFEIYRTVLHGQLKTPGTDELTNRCFLSEGNRLVQLVVKKTKSKKISYFKKRASFNSKADDILAASDFDNLTIDEIIAILSLNKDLASKLALNKLLNEQLFQKVKVQQEELQKQLTQNQLDSTKQTMSLLKDNDWDAASEIISQGNELEDHEKLSIKLALAISSGQDWEIINELLNNGAQLQDNVIYILSQTNNYTLARNLLPYGLNLHLTDHTGNNAYFHSVSSGSKEMIRFLIANQVSINPEVKGLDSLDQALTLLEYRPDTVAIIELLIFGGKTILNSHKERVESYKNSSPEIYTQLIKKFPQLII